MLPTVLVHKRAISDIQWSLHDPNVLITASMDMFLSIWDVRKNYKGLESVHQHYSFSSWDGIFIFLIV